MTHKMESTNNDLALLEAQVLALVAWCDGSFDDAERSFFLFYLAEKRLSEAQRAALVDLTESPPDRVRVLETFTRRHYDEQLLVLQRAVLMAVANERLHDSERSLLYELARRAGVREVDRPKFRELFTVDPAGPPDVTFS